MERVIGRAKKLPRPLGSREVPLQVLEWTGTDGELLDLARSGAPMFAARLYDRFAPDINRVVFRTIGPDADHDDLVHDAFVQVVKKVHQVRDPDRLGSWVVSVTMNTVYRELSRRRWRRLISREAASQFANVHPGADHDARELLRATYRVLDAMPLKERRVFTLRHIDARPLAEVAELCGCSLPTVKRLLTNAQQRFERTAARREPALLERLRSARFGGDP